MTVPVRCGRVLALFAHDLEHAPCPRYALELVVALVGERDLRACEEIDDGARNENLFAVASEATRWPMCTEVPATSASCNSISPQCRPVGAEYSSGPVTCGLPERGSGVMDLRTSKIHPNPPVAGLVRSGQERLRIELLRGYSRVSLSVGSSRLGGAE